MRRQSGFTLIELGIALVIIGIMSVAVMKTDSMIRAARVSSAISLYSDVSEAVRLFRDNYHQWPGDMVINATAPEIPVRSECRNGNSNGLLDGTAQTVGSVSIEVEALCVPEMLVKAGIGTADTMTVQNGTATEEWAAFTTSYGPAWVRSRGTSRAAPADATERKGFAPASRFVLEFEALPCQAAAEIDRKLDNGSLKLKNGSGAIEPQKGIIANEAQCHDSRGAFLPDSIAEVYAIGF